MKEDGALESTKTSALAGLPNEWRTIEIGTRDHLVCY